MGQKKVKFDAYTIRDPIHGFILLSEKERQVIDTKIFQRLRRIRQLAMADLVYPGTTHTRFEHSLGVLHIASKIVEQLEQTGVLKSSDIQPIRLAALLHDLGHGPYSHISEYVLSRYYDRRIRALDNIEEIHEDITKKLILNSQELVEILGSKLRDEVISVFTNQSIRKEIVSGPLDADKMDYLLRDAHYAGVKYGTFDLLKILESMVPIGDGYSAHLGIEEEGIHAVEQLIMAKHHMTVQLYRHRVRAITDAMIIRGIELAIKCEDKEMMNLYKYDGTERYLKNYLSWWDAKVMDYILESNCKNAREIFSRLFERKLFKLIHKKGINEREIEDARLRDKFLTIDRDHKTREKIEKEISRIPQLNCKFDHVILNVVSIKNPTYRSPVIRISEDEIQVMLKERKTKYLKEIPWSVMNLAKVEDKQQYIEVYAPGDNWEHLGVSERKIFLKQTDKKIRDILYEGML